MATLTKHIPTRFFKVPSITRHSFNNRSPSRISVALSFRSSDSHRLVHEFDPHIPLETALAPPSSWYTDPSFSDLELDRVFYRGWQAVGYVERLKGPHEFFTGRLGNVKFVVCKDDNRKGWTYGLDGVLLKATRINGIQNFDDFGLIPLPVATWGPFILLNLDEKLSSERDIDENKVAREWLGSCADMLGLNGVGASLGFVCRREYNIECNWKVFCDNFIDGGYHVPYAHKGFASTIKLDTYSTEIFETVNIQSCNCGGESRGDDYGRLGSEALYAFIYPNFIVNRYGPWMETNLVLPLGPRKCLLVSDYFLEASFKNEDIILCESVQKESRIACLQDGPICSFCRESRAPFPSSFSSYPHHQIIVLRIAS